MMRLSYWQRIVLGLLLVPLTACDGSTTAPSSSTDSTTTTTVTAEPVTEGWTDTVPVAGSVFYAFSTAQSGTVNVTLESVGGQYVPSTVTMGIGIGTPDGTSCTVTSMTSGRAGSTPQVTGTYDAGTYCVSVADVGNLFAPATIAVTIAHF